MDKNDFGLMEQIYAYEPTMKICIGCGACTSTCTAGGLTSFNFRKMHTLVRRGEYAGVKDEIAKCMLCGKCRLVCPRGVNTRNVVLAIKKIL